MNNEIFVCISLTFICVSQLKLCFFLQLISKLNKFRVIFRSKESTTKNMELLSLMHCFYNEMKCQRTAVFCCRCKRYQTTSFTQVCNSNNLNHIYKQS